MPPAGCLATERNPARQWWDLLELLEQQELLVSAAGLISAMAKREASG